MAGWEQGNTTCIDKVLNDSYVTTSQVTSLVCFTYILPLIHNPLSILYADRLHGNPPSLGTHEASTDGKKNAVEASSFQLVSPLQTSVTRYERVTI